MAKYDQTNHCYVDSNGGRIPHCDFCGTTEKEHNVRQVSNKGGRPLHLCDNPVCNALGIKQEPKRRSVEGDVQRRPSARRGRRRVA